MKKRNLVLVVFLSFMLVSCGQSDTSSFSCTSEKSSVSVSNSMPILSGCTDHNFELEKKIIRLSTYDFIQDGKAVDAEDGDITSQITTLVTNHYTKEEMLVLDLSTHGLYDIYYEVKDSNGNIAYDKRYIVVGDPFHFLDENGNPKESNILSEETLKIVRNSYKVIFEEEFNYTGAPGSDAKENDYNAYLYQTGGGGWGNQEVQIYEENIRTCFVDNGKLNIKVISEDGKYYSARLNTKPSFSSTWKYGKYEVVAKVPKGKGIWPAIWMMPNNDKYGGWPKSGEIDIMETSQYFLNKFIGTVHTESFNHTKNTQKSGSVNSTTIYNQYHKYSIEWLPDRIVFMFDDKEYFTFMPTNYVTNITSNEWPYDHSFHFIFNIAMGGSMGGSIDPNVLIDNDVTMSIDSIKVYQSAYINQNY